MPRQSHEQEFVDLATDSECESKGSMTNKRKDVDKSGRSKNAVPFFSPLPPKKRFRRIGSSRRHNTNKDKLSTEIFELCMEDIWTCMDDPKKKGNYERFDSLWFNLYSDKNYENKASILQRIKEKEIFSRRYVFVPILLWGHWNLLVLCNFGETNYLGTEKGPRMLLLDSLKTTNPIRLRLTIDRFIEGIFKNQEREDLLPQFKSKVKLEIPEVPQQTGEDCGIYVLYFVYCFLVLEELGENLSKLDAMFNPEELENIENIRRDIHSFLTKREANRAG